MSTKIRNRKVEWVPQYERRFVDARDTVSSGFPCDKDGKLLEPGHEEYLQRCKADPGLQDIGVCEWEKKEITPAMIKCDCGREIELWDVGQNRCECGEFYNGFGQHLCHPRYWGEETGEVFDDDGNFVSGPEL